MDEVDIEIDNRDVRELCLSVQRNQEGRHPMTIREACNYFGISKTMYLR